MINTKAILFIVVFRDGEISRSNLKRDENELELMRKMQQEYMRKLRSNVTIAYTV